MTTLRSIKRRSPLAGMAMASSVLMWAALSAQSAEQQIVADVSMALGGRERILAVKTLIVEGGGRDLNVGQSLRFDDLRAAVGRLADSRIQAGIRLGQHPRAVRGDSRSAVSLLPGRGCPRLIQGLDGEIAFNVNAEGGATRIFGPQATGRLAEYLAASAHVSARCTPTHGQIVERAHARQRAARRRHDWWSDAHAGDRRHDETAHAGCPDDRQCDPRRYTCRNALCRLRSSLRAAVADPADHPNRQVAQR